MSDIHGLTNAGYKIEWGGKTLTFKELTNSMRGSMTAAYRQQALNDTLDLKAILPPKDYRNLLLDTRRDITAGTYDFGSPWHTDSAMQTVPGISVFIRGMTGENLSDDQVFEFLQAKGDELAEILKLLFGDKDPDAAVP